jgi:hypothetical protein
VDQTVLYVSVTPALALTHSTDQYCDDLITDVRLLVRALHRRRIEVDLNEMDENKSENGVYLMDEQVRHVISTRAPLTIYRCLLWTRCR